MNRNRKLVNLTFKDAFLFCTTMCNETVCRGVLEQTLEVEIERIIIDKEKSIIYNPEYRGVRLDIIVKDEHHTRYNIEMQIRSKPALGKRTRYYHSQLDMEMLESGIDYRHLPDAYVIFICDYDPFGAGKYRYTWEMICKEDPALELADGTHTIILSTRGKNEEEVPKELAAFLKYVRADLEESTADYGSSLVSHIQKVVGDIKTSREMEAKYMLWEEMVKEEREEAFQDGRESGLAEGHASGLAEGRASGLAEGHAAGRIEMLLMLSGLQGELSAQTRERILKEEDPVRLQAYFRKAQEAATVEAFEEWMSSL